MWRMLRRASLLLFIASRMLANDVDKQQPLFIVADEVLMNTHTHITIYTGHVHAQQGTSHLTADKVITFKSNQNKMQKIIAYGKQAKYNTLPNDSKDPLYASADVLIFKPNENMIQLRGNGVLTQAQRKLTGEKIYYNTAAQTLYSAQHESSRTTIIIPPSD